MLDWPFEPGAGLEPGVGLKIVRLNRNKNKRLSAENTIPAKWMENS
jgi:hypothetical protein